MSGQVKALRRKAVIAALVLYAANTALNTATHHGGVAQSAAILAGPVIIASGVHLLCRGVGHFVGPFGKLYGLLVDLAKKSTKASGAQLAVAAYAATGWAGTLTGNTWRALRGDGPWLNPGAIVTNPAQAFAFAGGVLGAILIFGLIGAAVFVGGKAYSQRKQAKDDPHSISLEKALAPTMKDVDHLTLDPSDPEAATRPYIGDALVRAQVLGVKLPVYKFVSLYLPVAAAGLGVFGPPGVGKGANTIANTACRVGGPRQMFDDGHSLGFMGPQVLSSNSAEIANSLQWRLFVVRASLRLAGDGVEPTHEEVRELVSIYDPTGVCATDPKLRAYVKGWSPLDRVVDADSANEMAGSLLAEDLATVGGNTSYFAEAAQTVLTAMMLAAVQDRTLGMTKCVEWVNSMKSPDSTVLAELAKLLKSGNGSPTEQAERARVYAALTNVTSRLAKASGEDSAVFGSLEKAMKPFSRSDVLRSIDADHNPAGMVDMVAAVTRPYATTYVVMPPQAEALTAARPVFLAFMSTLLAQAQLSGNLANPATGALPLPLLITGDEFENTLLLPNLGKNLASVRKHNIRIQWVTQTQGGLAGAFDQQRMEAIMGNSGVVLTYHGYGTADAHIQNICTQIGSISVSKVSRSKKRGDSQHESENESRERVQVADPARLMSGLKPGQMLCQTSGSTRGMDTSTEQLRPFVVRQRRGAASSAELKAGWWCDPVTNARLVRGDAVGVRAQSRPTDVLWLRPAQRALRLAADLPHQRVARRRSRRVSAEVA